MKQIELSQGKYAIVDDADYEWLSEWKWTYLITKGHEYACRNVYRPRKQHGMMHREIMRPGAGMVVHHLNGNGIDNRRANLLVCTPQRHKSFYGGSGSRRPEKTQKNKYKGVCRTPGGRWAVTYQRRYIGTYNTPEDAALAYNDAAMKQPRPGEYLNPVSGKDGQVA